MSECSYWEPGMDAPIACEYMGLAEGSRKNCIKLNGKYKMVEPSCVFDSEWDALETQQEVEDKSLFNYGAQVFYAEHPEDQHPKRCLYTGPYGKNSHTLKPEYGGSFVCRADQIYGVYAAPKGTRC